MTQKEKRHFMKIAMNAAGINAGDKQAAVMVEIYEHLIMYKSNVTIKQIIAIEKQMDYEYDEKTIKP